LAGGFISVLSIAVWVKLPRNVDLVCFVWFMVFAGLTCDFVGEYWGFICKLLFSGELPGRADRSASEATAKAKTTAIDQSLRPSDFAPAFGRSVAASRRLLFGTRSTSLRAGSEAVS
jgi:hypothetical protein